MNYSVRNYWMQKSKALPFASPLKEVYRKRAVYYFQAHIDECVIRRNNSLANRSK